MNFNLNRFGKLIRRDWLIFQKPIGYAFLALCILLVGIVFMTVQFNEEDNLSISFWINTFLVFLLGGGALITSVIYWEFRYPAGRINYLSIPASHLEKVLSRWIYSFLLYPLILAIFFYLLMKLTEVIDGPIYHDMVFGEAGDVAGAFYLMFHPIIFMFAIWINKYVAPKAAIISVLAMIVCSLLGVIVFRIMFADLFSGWEMTGDFTIEPKPDFKHKAEHHWFGMMRKILMLLSVLFFGTVAYFKMNEKQV